MQAGAAPDRLREVGGFLGGFGLARLANLISQLKLCKLSNNR